MPWVDRNTENRDYDSASIETEIDGERFKEGVSGSGWGVVLVVVRRHITELMGEVDSCSDPDAAMQWRGGEQSATNLYRTTWSGSIAERENNQKTYHSISSSMLHRDIPRGAAPFYLHHNFRRKGFGEDDWIGQIFEPFATGGSGPRQ